MFDPVYHTATMNEVREKIKKNKFATSDDVLLKIESRLEKNGIRMLNYLKDKGTGIWLVATPSFVHGAVLSTLEFRDELIDHLGLKFSNTPSHCDGYTSEFSTIHALSCKVGGLIHSRHDESCDPLGYLSYANFQPSNVRDEPLINPCRDIEGKNDGKIVEPQPGLEIEAVD